MTPERWQKAKDLFLRLRNAGPDQQTGLLDEACRDDPELRAEVQSLLSYGDQAANFLEEPALRITANGEADDSAPPAVGRRIGAYTIIREIAAGGMGIVYEARQEHPSRVVALKIMKAGLASPTARRRFEDESQTLARLQHPAVAQVYEAGTHAEGELIVPYFAMEFVPDAKTITEFARANRLDQRRLLELFLEVCDAVHHGHQKGIIHRDLKPANIVVAVTGQPKVIDFGIARMIDPAATAATTQTATGQFVGTLQYMSPEQLEGDPHELDVRSDVYALGVVLFELLCGQLPYDVTRSGIYEAARTIKEQPPLRPSAVHRALRGDLDTIILRCLEKERVRRYQSVADLAGDLRRHLRHEPIEARRDSTFYVLRRNLYRHRWATAVAVTVLGMAVAAAWALSSREQAEAARLRSALSLARTWTRDNAPVGAADMLWREFLKRDCDRTRFALWEFYLKYPRIHANANFGSLIDVEYSPSGRWLAMVTDDGRTVIYEGNTGTVSHEAVIEGVQARSLKFSPFGTDQLYIGDATGVVHVFTFDEISGRAGDELYTLDLWDEQTTSRSAVGSLAVSPCGRWVAAGSDLPKTQSDDPIPPDARIRLWQRGSYERAHEWNETRWALTGLAFSSDGQVLGATLARYEESHAQKSCALVWKTATGELACNPKFSASPRRGALFSEDASRFFTGESDLLDWNIQGDTECRHRTGRLWGIRSLAAGVGPTAWHVVVGCGDGSVRFYDVEADQFLPTRGYHDIPVADPIDVAVSPDGRFVASVGRDGLSIWRFSAADEVRLSWPLGTGDDMALAGGGLVAAHIVEPSDTVQAADRHSVVELWSGGTLIGHAPSDVDSVMSLCAEGSRLAVSQRGRDTADDAKPGHSILVFRSPDWTGKPLVAEITNTVTALEWLDPEGRFLLVGLDDGRVAVCPVERAPGDATTPLITLHQFSTACTRFAVDYRGEWLAACSEGGRQTAPNGHVCVWRVADVRRTAVDPGAAGIKPVSEFAVHSFSWSVAFVRDGSDRLLVATSGRPREVQLWDARSGNPRGRLVGHGDAVRRCVALGRNRLVTASDDLTVRLWDVPTREELCVLDRTDEVTPRIAAAGGRIVIGCRRAVRVLDTSDVDRVITQNYACEAPRRSRLDPGVSALAAP